MQALQHICIFQLINTVDALHYGWQSAVLVFRLIWRSWHAAIWWNCSVRVLNVVVILIDGIRSWLFLRWLIRFRNRLATRAGVSNAICVVCVLEVSFGTIGPASCSEHSAGITRRKSAQWERYVQRAQSEFIYPAKFQNVEQLSLFTDIYPVVAVFCYCALETKIWEL